MKTRFLIKRTLFVVVVAFLGLATVYWMRGDALEAAMLEAARWAGISAGVHLLFSLLWLRNPRARACALCDDGVAPRDTRHEPRA